MKGRDRQGTDEWNGMGEEGSVWGGKEGRQDTARGARPKEAPLSV